MTRARDVLLTAVIDAAVLTNVAIPLPSAEAGVVTGAVCTVLAMLARSHVTPIVLLAISTHIQIGALARIAVDAVNTRRAILAEISRAFVEVCLAASAGKPSGADTPKAVHIRETRASVVARAR